MSDETSNDTSRGTAAGDAAATSDGDTSGAPARSTAALIIAAVLVVGVVALVLIFGVARPPELATVAEAGDPAPPASVAWTRWDEGFACVDILAPDGTVTEVTCDLAGGQLLAWDAEGIALSVAGPQRTVEVFDPVTGEVVDRRDIDSPVIDRRAMDAVRVRHADGTLTVRLHDTDAVLWEVDAHDNYRVREGSLSPDGEWVAMFDNAGRLLVVPADGSLPPRVWHEAEEHWQAPVWEGTPLPEASTD